MIATALVHCPDAVGHWFQLKTDRRLSAQHQTAVRHSQQPAGEHRRAFSS